MKKFIVLLMATFSIAMVCNGLVLIDTSFEDADGWGNSGSSPWTMEANDGSWIGDGTYANTGSARTGTRKVGFNSSNDSLELPTTNKPNEISFYYRTSSSPDTWTMYVQHYDGSSWTNCGASFTDPGDDNYHLVTRSVTINADNQRLRLFMQSRSSGSCYVDDMTLNNIPEPATFGLIGLALLFFRRK